VNKTTAAVLGVGQMGKSALRILLQRCEDMNFVALDRDADALRAAVELDPDRVVARHADLSTGELDFRDCVAVLNLAGPFFTGSDVAARAALAHGIHYVDVADDVETTEAVLALDEEAKRLGVSLLTGAGLSPGVSNWMAAALLAEHDDCDGIQVAWVVHEPDPGGLAPLRHMLHMAVSPCPVWVEGHAAHSAGYGPQTAARFPFPEPFGIVEAYDTAHPEPVTLPRRFPDLRYVSCKGALQPEWANAAFSTLGRIGFGYHDTTVDINGQEINPAEVLWQLMWERYRRRGSPVGQAYTAIRVAVLRSQQEVAAQAIIDDEAMARGTGIGAAVALDTLLRSGAPTGANGVEVLDYATALSDFHEIAASHGAFGSGTTTTELVAGR
jgi:lysine 6-dehydrogenase